MPLPKRPQAKHRLKPARAAAPQPAEIPAIPRATHLETLANGLTIIVREDHSAPVVSAQAWCRTGSIDEGPWLGAGLSHVIEHMLFKGTTTRGPGRIDQEVQAAGGYMNAYTSFDRTVYWINVPNTGARIAVDILCDIMQNASLPADELAKELEVIRREMDMGQDDPHRRSSRRLFEVAYTRSPYRYTIIGYPDIFNELKPDDIRAYYRDRYVPNNVFFIVAGDVKAAEVVAQIREAWAKSPARSLRAAVLPEEPPQMAAREILEEAPIELGHFHLSWHIPDLRHPDVPLLDVLALILGSGRSSRLYQQIRERQGLVHSVDSWTYNPGNPGLIGVSAVVDADKFAASRDAILAEVERVRSTRIPAKELSKAVKQITAATLGIRKTMQGQAQDLGSNWMAATDLNFSERYLEAVKLITPDALLRVARKYLAPGNRTLYALLPSGTAPRSITVGDQASDQAVQKLALPGGLRLLLREDHRLPFVEFRAVFKGGVLAENVRTNGVTQLMTNTLLKGTRQRSAEQIATEIESLGGSLDSYGGNNSFGVTAEVLSADFQSGLDLVADVILHASFPAAALEREREVQLAAIKAQRDQLLQSAGKLMRRALFGNDGYGLDLLGSEESVPRVGAAEVREFHRKLATPDNCVFAIVGDIRADAARKAVERTFRHWKAAPGERFRHATPATADGTGPKRTGDTRDKKQAVVLLGFPGTTLHDDARFALELIQEACSDLGSRLFLRVREKLGLAYYVGAQNFLGLAPGYFAFYAGTAPDKTALVEEQFWQEVDLLCSVGLTEEELQRSKAKIVGQRKIARQDLGALAMTMALDELYGLGYANIDTEDARYEAVTLDQVRAVAAKYLRREASVIAVIKPGVDEPVV